MYPNTEQIVEQDEEIVVIEADYIYASSEDQANCIALEVANADLFEAVCRTVVPTADDQELDTDFETELELTLTGTSPFGGTLIFTITEEPAHGTLSGTEPNLTYTPDALFSGEDSFQFTVFDGFNTSAPATVTINVGLGALPQSIEVNYELATAITLSGTIDPETLTYVVTTPPTHGELTGTGRNLTYTPDDTYIGPDSFEFTVSDGVTTSAPATVTIEVLDPGFFYADFITLQYQFVDGQDLDTRTSLSSPLPGTEVGYCKENQFIDGDQVWYEWGGDNTGSGFESVLFYVGRIRSAYPGSVIEGLCKAWWYYARDSGDVTIQLHAYSGGFMNYVFDEYRWENVGGTEVASLTFDGNVSLESNSCVSDAECITGFTYDTEANVFIWTAC